MQQKPKHNIARPEVTRKYRVIDNINKSLPLPYFSGRLFTTDKLLLLLWNTLFIVIW